MAKAKHWFPGDSLGPHRSQVFFPTACVSPLISIPAVTLAVIWVSWPKLVTAFFCWQKNLMWKKNLILFSLIEFFPARFGEEIVEFFVDPNRVISEIDYSKRSWTTKNDWVTGRNISIDIISYHIISCVYNYIYTYVYKDTFEKKWAHSFGLFQRFSI